MVRSTCKVSIKKMKTLIEDLLTEVEEKIKKNWRLITVKLSIDFVQISHSRRCWHRWHYKRYLFLTWVNKSLCPAMINISKMVATMLENILSIVLHYEIKSFFLWLFSFVSLLNKTFWIALILSSVQMKGDVFIQD